MKILITGGTGFVGLHVAEHYAIKGDDVVYYDNLLRAARAAIFTSMHAHKD